MPAALPLRNVMENWKDMALPSLLASPVPLFSSLQVVLQAQYEAERQAAAEAKRQAHEARLLEIEQVREEEHKERMQAAREAEEHR